MMDTSTTPAPPETEPRLAHLPMAFFAVVMGLSGYVLALKALGHVAAVPPVLPAAGLVLTVAVFAALVALHTVKAVRHWPHVRAEWNHPVRIAFFPAVSISVLLIATVVASDRPDLARGLWLAGAALQGVLTLAVVASWIGHRPFQPIHLSPAWFIPAVGNVIVPVAGVPLGFIELSWLYFSAGLVFWLVLLTLVMNRLVFHEPLPGRLTPTLVILIAPPAVAYIAYGRLTGEIDAFARVLLNAGYVFALVTATQLPKFRRLPFAMSWWALSFPVAALTIASLHFGAATGSVAHDVIGIGLFGGLSLIILGLVVRTVLAILRAEICRPEG